MTYQTELNEFNSRHTYQTITIDGATFRYLTQGKGNAPTLVFLNGGMVAQIYTQKYPDNVGGLILISTGGMDERTLKKLKMQYFFSPALLLFMKLADYDKLKPQLVKAGMLNMLKDSDPDDVDYVKDMFETLFRERMWKEKDVAISTFWLTS